MVLPVTHLSAFLLLLLSVVCFVLWPSIYKRVEGSWRFELFAVDFMLGATLTAVITAYTLGSLGPEMSFSDRILVAGRSAAVWIIGTGLVFTFGNTLLLASISLLGMAIAPPLTFATALMVIGVVHLRSSHAVFFLIGTAIILLSIGAAMMASRPNRVKRVSGYQSPRTARIKGITLAILSGLALGSAEFLLTLTADPDFGPGPYATLLMLAVGILISTPLLNYFLMHIKVTGDPIGYRSYFAGTAQQHGAGFTSGIAWSAGALGVLLALSVSGEQALGSALIFIILFASITIFALLGFYYWGESSAMPRSARIWLGIAVICFAIGVGIMGAGFST